MNFSDIVNYAHNHKSDTKRARILGHQGVCIVSNETIADSFNTNLRRADKNDRVHRISQPVKHIAISFSAEHASRFPDNEDGCRFAGSKLSKLKLTYGKLAGKFGEMPGERIASLEPIQSANSSKVCFD